MSIIVNNAFSTKMLMENSKINMEIITEEDFREAITIADEIIIGHEDTANYFGVPMNRQTIHLGSGDILFVCEANSENGGRLPSGTQFLEEMGEGFYFRFIRIEIVF